MDIGKQQRVIKVEPLDIRAALVEDEPAPSGPGSPGHVEQVGRRGGAPEERDTTTESPELRPA